MTRRRWKPLSLPLGQMPLSQLDEQIERAFESMLTMPWLADASEWIPQVDVFETADEFVIEADLPGVTMNDLSVEVGQDTVTICGSRSSERTETSRHGVVRVERRHGTFCRRLRLGQPVDARDVHIEQNQGVFRIRIPKLTKRDES